MPPSNCLASSSRSSHSAAIFKNALTADGLSRFTTSLLDRSAGWSHPNPARARLRLAIFAPLFVLHIWSIIHTLMDTHKGHRWTGLSVTITAYIRALVVEAALRRH